MTSPGDFKSKNYPHKIISLGSWLKERFEMSYVDKLRDERLFATKTMNANCSQYYDLVKKLSSLSGQWPYQKPITRLFCMILMTLSTMSMIIPQIAKFVMCNGNLQCIFQTMSAYMLTTITLVKLYTCYFNRCKVCKFVHFWVMFELYYIYSREYIT
ncbi:uncharacterized protein LOC105828699 [Monomorium pharaonis]|uniref:uncharacterized protein LOC105828699 n=1 Tax=Monomorium pharaonis TaxID=307658 RepID=UPI0017477617|nr:uncharacterized protein LOC105828699 [Monomorium pharaonis]